MDFKGSRTEQNLLAAFSGESMARNKYLFLPRRLNKNVIQRWPSSLSRWPRTRAFTAACSISV